MPIIKSAIKALRKDRHRTKINRPIRSQMLRAIKKAKKEASAKSLAKAYSTIDRAAKGKIIHKNTAARLKSRITRSLKISK